MDTSFWERIRNNGGRRWEVRDNRFRCRLSADTWADDRRLSRCSADAKLIVNRSPWSNGLTVSKRVRRDLWISFISRVRRYESVLYENDRANSFQRFQTSVHKTLWTRRTWMCVFSISVRRRRAEPNRVRALECMYLCATSSRCCCCCCARVCAHTGRKTPLPISCRSVNRVPYAFSNNRYARFNVRFFKIYELNSSARNVQIFVITVFIWAHLVVHLVGTLNTRRFGYTVSLFRAIGKKGQYRQPTTHFTTPHHRYARTSLAYAAVTARAYLY